MPDRPKLTSEPTPIQFERERLRHVVYAEAGVGKTTLALTYPKPLVIDTDGGLISVTVKRAGQYIGERWRPENTGQRMYKDLEAFGWWIKEHAQDKESIVIDSGDELVFLLLDELTEMGAAYDRAKSKDVHPVAEFVPEQAEYLANQRQMHHFLHFLRQLNKHVIITFGVREELGKRRPDVAPKLATVIERWASVLGELIVLDEDDPKHGVKAGDRALLTVPTSKRAGKSRFEVLRPHVINPTFDSMWTAIEKSYSQAEKGQTK